MPRLARLLSLVTIATICAVAPAGHAGAPDGKLLFEDDFEQGLAHWAPTDPAAWETVKEDDNTVMALVKSSDYEPAVRSPKSIAWLKDVVAGDFTLEVRLKQTGREYGHRDLCLFFGKQDASNFYYVHLATTADDHANSIFLVNDAPRVSIAKERTDGTKWTSGYHTVRIVREVKSGLIEVYFDDMDTPVMKAEDTTHGAGQIGLGSFDDVGHFDDVKIWTPEAAE